MVYVTLSQFWTVSQKKSNGNCLSEASSVRNGQIKGEALFGQIE